MKVRNILTLIIVALLSINVIAQSKDQKKLDRIIKHDYQIIDATITKISETEIEYTLPNETLINSLLLAHIARIEFASGRVQTFDAVPQDQAGNSVQVAATVTESKTPVIQENRIGILPIPYVDTDNMMT